MAVLKARRTGRPEDTEDAALYWSPISLTLLYQLLISSDPFAAVH